MFIIELRYLFKVGFAENRLIDIISVKSNVVK